jgi:hypothetical protein
MAIVVVLYFKGNNGEVPVSERQATLPCLAPRPFLAYQKGELPYPCKEYGYEPLKPTILWHITFDRYRLVVGEAGIVYEGRSFLEAKRRLRLFVKQSEPLDPDIPKRWSRYSRTS